MTASFDPYWSYPPEVRLTMDDIRNANVATEVVDPEEDKKDE